MEEAGPAFVAAGLTTSDQLQRTLVAMDRAMQNPNVLAIAPRMSLVSGRKRVN